MAGGTKRTAGKSIITLLSDIWSTHIENILPHSWQVWPGSQKTRIKKGDRSAFKTADHMFIPTNAAAEQKRVQAAAPRCRGNSAEQFVRCHYADG